MPVHTDEYNDVVARVNRKYEGDLKRGDEIENCARISTGSLELDVAMGGGVPQGRWTRFYGGYHSGKTLHSYSVIAQAQAMGLTAAYYNIEKQYHPEFVERWGVCTNELTVVEGSTVEEIGEKMEALFGVVHLHVIDSCSIAVSEDELNADVRDWRPGIAARAWGRVFRRLNERFDQRENTVILIDQVRVNFQTGGEQAAGGKVFDHQSSMSVLFKKGGWLFRNPETGQLDEKAKQEKGASGQIEPSGMEIKCRVEKSRVCRPFRTATRRFDLDSIAFDDPFEYKKLAIHFGIVRQAGRYFYYPAETQKKGEQKRFGSEAEFKKFISEDAEFRQKVRETALMAATG